MASLWSARKQALWACLAARPEGTQIWSTDVAVPISRMADMIGMYCAVPAMTEVRCQRKRMAKLTLRR